MCPLVSAKRALSCCWQIAWPKHFIQGDGDSAPATPPNEETASGDDNADIDNNNDNDKAAQKTSQTQETTTTTPTTSTAANDATNPFSFDVKVDVMAVGLFLVSLTTRLIFLDQPKNVV